MKCTLKILTESIIKKTERERGNKMKMNKYGRSKRISKSPFDSFEQMQFLSHLILVIVCSLYSLLINSVACLDGSTKCECLLNLSIMIAFSVQKSSAGNALANHLSLSSVLDKY